MGFEVCEKCMQVLIGSSVTIEYLHFNGKKWRKPEKKIRKNCQKFHRSTSFESALSSPDGNALDILRDESPKNPKKGETQSKGLS